MRRALIRAVAAAAMVSLFLPLACGVPSDEAPRFEADTEVPYDLLDSPSTTATSPTTPGPGPTVDLYFVDDDKLVVTARRLPADSTLGDLVERLDAEPTEGEVAVGLTTALTEDPSVREVQVTGGVAVVDLTADFVDAEGRRQLLAVAQIVCTLTGRPGVGQVSFTLEGEPVDVPRGDGSTTSNPVARDDYRQLLAA